MKISELLEGDVIDFKRKVHDLKNTSTKSTDPRTYRQLSDMKKRATAKASDLSDIEDKKIEKVKSKVEDGYLKEFFLSYMETALWSSNDPVTDDPLDHKYSIEQISGETMENMLNTCKHFLNKCGPELVNSTNATTAGHEFWLTRNRHGSGFQDGDYPKELKDYLTKIAQSFPESLLYIGDDGYIYQETHR